MSLDPHGAFPDFIMMPSPFACPKCQERMHLKIEAKGIFADCMDCKIEVDLTDDEKKLALKHNGIEE